MSFNEGYNGRRTTSTSTCIASECSSDCGGGSEDRTVECQDSTGNPVNISNCESSTKPSCSQNCNTQACSCTYGACDGSSGNLTQICEDGNGNSVNCNTYCPTQKNCGTWVCSSWGDVDGTLNSTNCS